MQPLCMSLSEKTAPMIARPRCLCLRLGFFRDKRHTHIVMPCGGGGPMLVSVCLYFGSKRLSPAPRCPATCMAISIFYGARCGLGCLDMLDKCVKVRHRYLQCVTAHIHAGKVDVQSVKACHGINPDSFFRLICENMAWRQDKKPVGINHVSIINPVYRAIAPVVGVKFECSFLAPYPVRR